MRKLELKELKGYLGTGLKMIFEGKGGRIIELQGICQTKLGVAITDGRGGMWLEDCGFKPILHPLSDLTKYCDDLGFVPIEWLEENMDNSKYKPSAIMSDGGIEIGFFDEFEKLHEWHFDIHNLIKDNLAIDINTIK